MALEVISLRDEAAGSSAAILPGLGFNCFSFIANPAGEPIEVLWASPDFAQGTVRPTRCGIPLLFPFAGRIRERAFTFAGRTYKLPKGDDLGNAIHGFVFDRPWRVIEQTPRRVVGQFQASVDEPAILEMWPADFRITVTYQLSGSTLAGEVFIENPDERVLPFGFGSHGYFRVPLGAGGVANDCQVRVPVSTAWELSNLLPTGERGLSPYSGPLRAGMTIGNSQLDDVFSGLDFIDHKCAARVRDPHSGRVMTLTFDDVCPHCVLFNPPHREAICIEPYTTVPDPFTLVERSVDPNLRLLAPGDAVSTRFAIRLD